MKHPSTPPASGIRAGDGAYITVKSVVSAVGLGMFVGVVVAASAEQRPIPVRPLSWRRRMVAALIGSAR
jgi:hypothetical protein